MVRAAGGYADLETQSLVPDSEARPADVFEIERGTGSWRLHDITVVCPTSAPHIRAAGGGVGVTARSACARKLRYWRQLQARLPQAAHLFARFDCFLPIVFETGGYMHPTAVREFDRLVSLVVQRAEHMGVLADRRVIRRYWLQCLSATLMRGVGHALHLHYTGRDTAALPTESTQFTVFAADTAIPV